MIGMVCALVDATVQNEQRPRPSEARDARRAAKRANGSPGRTRTCDKAVNSRLLYQLSYRGTDAREAGF